MSLLDILIFIEGILCCNLYRQCMELFINVNYQFGHSFVLLYYVYLFQCLGSMLSACIINVNHNQVFILNRFLRKKRYLLSWIENVSSKVAIVFKLKDSK